MSAPMLAFVLLAHVAQGAEPTPQNPAQAPTSDLGAPSLLVVGQLAASAVQRVITAHVSELQDCASATTLTANSAVAFTVGPDATW